jgi:hypothetical protein
MAETLPGWLCGRRIVRPFEQDTESELEKEAILDNSGPEWVLSGAGSSSGETPGPCRAGIDHITSTSVPGLRAKDVIDVQVVVAKLDT